MRILLFSDIHYTTDLSQEEMSKICPDAKVSVAAGDAFGHTQREKVEAAYEAILREHEKSPLDAVLMLGDLSIDDYGFRSLPENYCAKLKSDLLDKLPCPYYAIPGNHDSYPNELWREVFGTDRQFSVEIGGCGFILLDTYADFAARGASGSKYTPIDTEFLENELAKFKGKPVFLAAHMISEAFADEKLTALLQNNPNVVCFFRGHTHFAEIISTGDALAHRPIIDIGGFAYEGIPIDGRYHFDIFSRAWAWGYEMLEVDETIRVRHVKPAMHYKAANGAFDLSETVTGEVTLADGRMIVS